MAVIEVEDLRKVYGDRVVVDEVSFTVEDGEIFGILGPNGAGKTTTVECIEGLRRPDGGVVRVDGYDPGQDGARVRELLGVQLQQARLQQRIKVWEALDLYASFYADPVDWRDLLEQLGLSEQRNTTFGQLSGGQQQRLSIALSLVGRPRVAVLDELTTGLDPQARRDTWQLIEQVRDAGVTILLVTHFMEEAERLCDRLAILDQGRIVGLDRPAALVAGVGGVQRLHFEPSAPVEERWLAGLAEVTDVTREDAELVVTGTGNVVQTVLAALVEAQIVPGRLRVQQPTLDDAFVALTGRRLEQTEDAVSTTVEEVGR